MQCNIKFLIFYKYNAIAEVKYCHTLSANAVEYANCTTAEE